MFERACKTCKYSKRVSGRDWFLECSKVSQVYPDVVPNDMKDEMKFFVPKNFSCIYYERRKSLTRR